MAAIAWTDVVNHAAELADPAVPADAQTDLLALVNNMLNVAAFGGESSYKYKMARIYLIAHLASYTGGGGTAIAGPIISESEGGLSRSYAQLANAPATDGHWGATTYGSSYVALVRTLVGARLPFIAGAR